MITVKHRGIGGLIETLSDGLTGAARSQRVADRFTNEIAPKLSGPQVDEKVKKAFFDSFSIREAFVACTGDFPRFGSVQEAALKHTDFTVVILGGLSALVQAAYNTTEGLIGDKLVTPYNSSLISDIFPVFDTPTGMADVAEGATYGVVDIADRYVGDTTFSKRGAAVLVTEEAVLFDQTGQLISRCNNIGKQAALDREKYIIKGIQDLSAAYYCYYPAGSRAALYDTAQVKTSNALATYVDIEDAALYLSMTTAVDPVTTPDVIVDAALSPYTVLVPKALEFTALHIKNTLTVQTNPGVTSGVSPVMNNPVSIEVLSSPILDVDSASTWYFAGAGGFKRQFIEKIHFPMQAVQIPPAESNAIMADTLGGVRVRYKSKVFALDNKFVVKNTA